MKKSGSIDSVLETGIYTSVAGKKVQSFPRYREEIESFNGDLTDQLPFVNQRKPLRELAARLVSDYPYACLVHHPGIGKTMIIDYVVKNIVDPNGLEVIRREAKELVPTFEAIREQASEYTHRDYMLLPNLTDPMDIEALDYTDGRQAEKDIEVAKSFFGDVITILGNYARDNRANIRVELTEKEFRGQVRSKVSDMYAELYDRICDLTMPENRTKRKTQPQYDFAMATFSLPESLDNLGNIKAEYKFVVKGEDKNPSIQRYKTEAKKTGRGETLETISKGLANNLVHSIVKPLILNTLWELKLTDVKKSENEFFSVDETFAMLKEEFNKYTKEVVVPMERQYKKGTILNQRQMLSNIRTSEPRSAHGIKISPRTLDDVVQKISTLRDKYKGMCSLELDKRLDGYVSYFDKERMTWGESMKMMHDEIRIIEKKDPPKLTDRSKKSNKEKRDNEEKEEERIRKESYKNVKFRLKHGKGFMSIENIMKVNAFRDASATGGVTITEVSDFTNDNMYGTFNEHKSSKNPETDPTVAPHMTYQTLGEFFKGGILIFPDRFGNFVKSIVSEHNVGESRIEAYLSYFQTKVMTVTNDGIKFKFKAPRILIGSDNNDPFVTTDGFFVNYQEGLRDRIKLINVNFYDENTPRVREGTISVIRNSLNRFRQKRSERNGNLEITTDAEEMLLQSTLFDEHIALLTYREVDQKIADLCEFAIQNNAKEITPDLIRKKLKEGLNPAIFWSVDREAYEWDGWFNQEDKQVGFVIGLTAAGKKLSHTDHVGGYIKIRTGFFPDKDPLPRNRKRFELYDRENGLLEATASKGFDQATDFMRKYLYEIRGDEKGRFKTIEGWQVKTDFEGNWAESGGPSASLAITSSMISTLSEIPIYKNRFITGTLDPTTGNAGVIGGTYMKGLIPLRIHDLMPVETKQPLYFLFPARNTKDLTEEIIFDPFGLEGKITALPIRNIADAFHLLTCGPEITKDDWKNIDELGHKALEDAKEKIKNLDKIEQQPLLEPTSALP